jgi:RNA ligase (TIGR02306 family)
MTKLASIEKIIGIEKIDGADNICSYKVLGWNVVGKINEFNIGDMCIYVSLDSILPEKPEFEFLRNKQFRIYTVKLKGTISQGIIFPLSMLGDISGFVNIIEEGMDVTEHLGITKYEKPIPVEMKGLIRGNFPPFVPRTDEERIQNYPKVIDELTGKDVYITVKCDGTSWTSGYNDGDFFICSRRNSLKINGNKTNTYVLMALEHNLEEKFKKIGKNIAIQAELCGPGIQKNPMGLTKHKLFIFNVWFISEQRYGNMQDVIDISEQLGIDHVPIEYQGPFIFTMDELINFSKGFYNNTNKYREGIVVRPTMEIYSNVMKSRLSFKVLNPDFLFKNKE